MVWGRGSVSRSKIEQHAKWDRRESADHGCVLTVWVSAALLTLRCDFLTLALWSLSVCSLSASCALASTPPVVLIV